ncbi:MAG: hypothetical protein NUV77_17200, partial [Thermoguttaceae bacterium]|nr:hypothetical protein [Thermoguttaceae bacterium]
MSHPPDSTSSHRLVVLVISLLLVAYVAAAAWGLPQQGTEAIAQQTAGGHGHEPSRSATPAPPHWTILPFALLLGAIAVFPLAPRINHWWESNLHRFYVAAGLGLVTLLYY